METYYCVQISPPLVPVWAKWIQSRRFYPMSLRFFFNIILPPKPRYLKWSVSLRILYHALNVAILCPISAIWLAHLILLNLITLNYLVRSSNRAAPHCAVSSSPLITLSLLSPNISLSTQFSHIPNLFIHNSQSEIIQNSDCPNILTLITRCDRNGLDSLRC